jgi:hypothetical protein
VLPVRYELLQVASISQLTVSRLSRQCGILNISQPYKPPRPVPGIAFYFSFRPGLKRPGREADHSLSTNAEVRKMCTCASTPDEFSSLSA